MFQSQIPTLWLLIGGCAATLLLLVALGALVMLERRSRIFKWLRLSARIRRLPFLAPLMQNVQAVESTQRRVEHARGQAASLQGGVARDKAAQQPAPAQDAPQQSPFAPPPGTAVAPDSQTAAGTIPPPARAIGPQVGRVSSQASTPAAPETYGPGLVAGQAVDRYQIDAFIGEGNAGSVYQAYDMTLAQKVTLKLLHPALVNQFRFQEHFAAAVQAVAALDHPSIINIKRYKVQEGRAYLVREFVPGPRLDIYIHHQQSRDQFVSLNETLRLVAQVAEALGHAHRHGIVHGRIQPGNVLLQPLDRPDRAGDPPMRAMVTDFALDRLFEGHDETPETVYKSMWPYMSPEQSRNEPLDSRSDIYSLGILLYQLATGRSPFNVTSAAAARASHSGETPPAPLEVRPTLPEGVAQIIMQAIAKDPAARFQTGEEMAQALRQVVLAPTDVDSTRERQKARQEVEGDQIIISGEGERPQLFKLEGDAITIGSAAGNDITLPGKGVAAHHARLERSETGWRVADLGSAEGTFIESMQLLPDLLENWEMNQPLQIGPYILRWQRKRSAEPPPAPASPSPARPPQALAARAPQSASLAAPATVSEDVEATLEPVSVEIVPGERVDMQVTLVNQGTRVDHFHLRLQGLPGEWVTISENDIQLMPGAQGYLLLTIHPPGDSSAVAGEYIFDLLVNSRYMLEEKAAAVGRVVIRPFTGLVVDMQPERLRNQGTCQVQLYNAGNQPLTCTMRGRDPAQEIVFGGEQGTVQVGPGQTLALPLTVTPQKRPFLGTARFLPFEVEVTADSGEAIVKPGQLEILPVVPPWLPTILGMLLIFLCVGGALLFSFINNRRENTAATATAEAEATATAMAAAAITPTLPLPTGTPTPIPNPSSCAQIREQNPQAADGEYALYLNGDETLPFAVYCHNMVAGPAEYLSLNSSGLANYSLISYPEGALVTRYERIRFNPATLIVDRADMTFAIFPAQVEGYTAITGENVSGYPVGATDYARAEGCNRGTSSAPPGRANIDLGGTDFVVAESVIFASSGGGIENPVADISEDRKVVDLSINGRCAQIQPQGALRLAYASGEAAVEETDDPVAATPQTAVPDEPLPTTPTLVPSPVPSEPTAPPPSAIEETVTPTEEPVESTEEPAEATEEPTEEPAEETPEPTTEPGYPL